MEGASGVYRGPSRTPPELGEGNDRVYRDRGMGDGLLMVRVANRISSGDLIRASEHGGIIG